MKFSIVTLSVDPKSFDGDYSKKRNELMKKSSTDWIFFVDTDETYDQHLIDEIASLPEEGSLYLIPRVDLLDGTKLNFGESGHQYLTRLVNRKKGQWVRPVHEVFVAKVTGKLKHVIYHHKNQFVTEHLSKISLYGHTDGLCLNKEGKTFSYLRLLFYPKLKFLKNYFFKLGFLDGTLGLFHAYLMYIQSLSNRVFQWESRSHIS